MDNRHKALLIPINAHLEVFIQDRTGHKPPPWGFFGGGIEKSETPLEAIVREAKEELDVDLLESELQYIGDFSKFVDGIEVHRHMFLWPTEQTEFTVLEGRGGYWFGCDVAQAKLLLPAHLDRVWDVIKGMQESSNQDKL